MQQQIGYAPVRTPIFQWDPKSIFSAVWQNWLLLLAAVINNITRTFIPGVDTLTYAATISLDPTKGDLHQTTTTAAVGNATINALAPGVARQEIFIQITNDATANRTITFGTNLKATGTIVGTTSKTAIVSFISDGTAFRETARTTGL